MSKLIYKFRGLLGQNILFVSLILFFSSAVLASGRIKFSVYQSVSCKSPGSSEFQNSTKTEDVNISDFERTVIFNTTVDKETLSMSLQTCPMPDGKIKLDYTPFRRNGLNYTQGSILIDGSGHFSKLYFRFRENFENSEGKGYCSYQLIFLSAQ